MSVAARTPRAAVVLPLAALTVGVAAWWLLVTALALPAYVLPPPTAVARRLATNPDLYAANALTTLRRIVVGGAVGVLVGAALAVVVVEVRWLRRALVPYLVAARVLPKIAVAPVLLIYFGTGEATGIAFVALVAFFPMVVSTVAGLESVPEAHLDLLRSVDAGRLATLVHLRVPHAVPDAFAGLKQSTTLAVIGAVIAEWLVSTEGLGALILFALEDVQVDVMLAALAVLFAEGLALYGLVVAAERRVGWTGGDPAPGTEPDAGTGSGAADHARSDAERAAADRRSSQAGTR